jgi:YggT family protein
VQILLGLFGLINEILSLYWWAIIIAAVLSNLLAFGVLDRRSRFVWSLGEFFYRITEPALRPIRRVIPAFGGIDVSPIILLLLLGFVQRFVLPTVEQALFSAFV